MKPPETEDVYGVQKSVLKFTCDFCKKLAENIEGNYFCSSLSAHIALTLAAFGADESTAAQMRKVLRIKYSNDQIHRNYRKILDILYTDENKGKDSAKLEEALELIRQREDLSDEEKKELIRLQRICPEEEKSRRKRIECVTTLASKMYICHNSTPTVYEFLDPISLTFRMEIETLNFWNPSQGAQIINDWCTESTNGRIRDIIKTNELPGSSSLVLVSAVHFKGTWLFQFADAIPRTFYLSLFETIEVPTMCVHRELQHRYLAELNADSVQLDFMRSKKYMEVIVPRRTEGLRATKKMLYKVSNQKFLATDVCLWLPKFEIQSIIKLEDHLKIGDVFNKNQTNFNNICDTELFIKTAIQKAYIKVDERGCESTAARVPPGTFISDAISDSSSIPPLMYAEKKPKPIIIEANRPFLFRIMSKKLNVPLFIGIVVDPST